MRKARGPYLERNERKRIEYQDGLPVIEPEGEEDAVFRDIAEHRAAAAHYERCLTAEDAESVSDAALEHLQQSTSYAFQHLMLRATCLILRRPTTRRGLIHQARYLAAQMTDWAGCNSGGPYLPDRIGHDEKPWPLAFLQSLAGGLRKMAGEFDADRKEVRP